MRLLLCASHPRVPGVRSGTDFDRKIVVKPRAAELLREAFDRPKWRGEPILLSGNTDCYQPLEASYLLTGAASRFAPSTRIRFPSSRSQR